MELVQDTDSDSDVDQEVQVGEVGIKTSKRDVSSTILWCNEDFISGRVIRKRTAPSRFFSSKIVNCGVVEEPVRRKSIEVGIQTDDLEPVLAIPFKIMVDEYTQTGRGRGVTII